MTTFLNRLRSFWIIPLLATAHAEPVPLQSENAILKTFLVKASQGVAVGEKHFYAISNTKITTHDKKSGKLLAEWDADRKKDSTSHFKHLNSGTVINGKLYCAHSRFPLDPNASSVEIFDISGEKPEHESTIRLPRKHGSLTWIDRKADGSWWMCFAVYGKPANRKTKLVKYGFENGNFTEQGGWFFPEETVSKWGTMSCSGGSWGPDGHLYVTGHDNAEVHVLEFGEAKGLRHLRTEPVPGIFGQAIAWDRSSEKPTLWGIVKNKHVSVTEIPMKR